MTKYNITEVSYWKGDRIRYKVDAVGLDMTRPGGVFDTREEAEKRVEELKTVKGTRQPVWFRLRNEESLEAYKKYLDEHDIKYSVQREDTDYLLLIDKMSEEEFLGLTKDFK